MLHQKAWDIADEYFSAQEQKFVKYFQDNLGRGRGVDDLVETLFVAENDQVWRIFDADK